MPRFLHAADLHLDSPLLGLSLGDEKADESVRAATRRAFERLVEVAVAEGVRFVVLAGDVVDGRDSSFESTVFLNTHAGRLFREHGIRTYMVRGNHDPENLFARKLVTPEGLHVFSADAAESIEVPGEGVVLHGRSYPTQAVREDLVPGYGAPVPGKLNVGVLHTALSAAPRDGHEPYAPTTLSELADKGYAYWALGHVHTRATYEERGTKAVFPGNLQSRHAREAERFEHPAREGSPGSITGRGVAIVDYEGTAITGVRHVPCDVVRWLHLAIDVSGNFDDAHFPNAVQFDHDRFAGASERQYAPGADILTFGKGTHHCVGSRLGQLEMMHAFTQLLERVGRIEAAGELPVGVGFFLHSPPSLPVVLHPVSAGG